MKGVEAEVADANLDADADADVGAGAGAVAAAVDASLGLGLVRLAALLEASVAPSSWRVFCSSRRGGRRSLVRG